MIGVIANNNQTHSQVRAIQRRVAILKVRFQNSNGKDLLEGLEGLEGLEKIENTWNICSAKKSKNSLMTEGIYKDNAREVVLHGQCIKGNFSRSIIDFEE